jgi:hypothetical protein
MEFFRTLLAPEISNVTVGLVGLAPLALIYFLPTVLAWRRCRDSVGAVFIFNLAFGATVIGWWGLLAWVMGRAGAQAPPRS